MTDRRPPTAADEPAEARPRGARKARSAAALPPVRGNVVFEAGRCRICREELKPNRQKRKRKSTTLTQAKRLERQVNLNWRHADSADASQVFADLTAR